MTERVTPGASEPLGGGNAPAVIPLVEHLFRHRAGRLVAALARRLGPAHLELAEDIVQDALLEALRTWPFRGVPDDPAAWLFRVARNRALDAVRRDATLRHYERDITRWAEPRASSTSDDGVGDDELALVFACCHPAVPREAGVALALRTVAGFGVGEIARAFLAEESAIAQRLVRAKRRLREGGVHVAVPERESELAARLPAVLDTLYLIFNEGYHASAGDELVRRDLCREALRLARLVACHPSTAGPAPDALAALLCFHAARLDARTDAAGEVVLLTDQDRSRWNARLVALGFGHLKRAGTGHALTRYHLEAQIASYHAAAPSVEATNWPAVLEAYDALLMLAPSSVVALHRAVAIGMVHGPDAALRAIATLDGTSALARYVWFHATRGYWRSRLGLVADAAADYRTALTLAAAEPVRRFLRERLAGLDEDAPTRA